MHYGSNPANEIFQRRPPLKKPSQFRLKSWTDTVEGYKHEAKKLTTCILKNRKLLGRSYSWFVTIYVRKVMPPDQAAELWTKACRSLRRLGVVALWVREPTRKNKVHYHLIVSSQQTKTEIIEAVEASMPPRSVTPWHKNVKPVDHRWWLAYYITKAQIRGRFRGQDVPDKYMTKRLLFKAKSKLRKHGTIGDFWLRATSVLWKEVQDVEKQIAEGLADDGVQRLIRHVRDLLGEDVATRRIERSFGYYANSQSVQDWIAAISVD